MHTTWRKSDDFDKALVEYEAKIKAMDDSALMKEAEQKIWLSAFAANNPKSDYHWQCDAVYDECMRRGKVDTIYKPAWERASKQ